MTTDRLVHLLPMAETDAREIQEWPDYSGDFSAFNYAIRPGGWLDQFPESAITRRFVVREAGQIMGFSILTDISDSAEFYVAVHPKFTGGGYGGRITQMTLETAFRELGLARVYLKVRIWHETGIRLYEKLGFRKIERKIESIQGESVEFWFMEVNLGEFLMIEAARIP